MTMLLATKMTVAMPSEIFTVLVSDSGVGGIDEHGKVVLDAFGIETETNGQEKSATTLHTALRSQLDLSPLQSFWFEGAKGAKVVGDWCDEWTKTGAYGK